MRSDITCVMRGHHHELDASVGASGPHDFAVRQYAARQREGLRLGDLRPLHPAPNVRDDRDTPLSKGYGMARVVKVIWVGRERKCFYGRDWTGAKSAEVVRAPIGQSALCDDTDRRTEADHVSIIFKRLSLWELPEDRDGSRGWIVSGKALRLVGRADNRENTPPSFSRSHPCMRSTAAPVHSFDPPPRLAALCGQRAWSP
jgi:hypothetical protein